MTAVRRWPIWSERARVLAAVFAVDVAAVALVIVAVAHLRITPGDLLRLGALLALSLAYAEASRQVELRRKLFATGDPAAVNMASMWCFAAVLLLPTGLAVTIPVVTYVHMWRRSWRHVEGRRLYRSVYSGAVAVLCVLAASAVVHQLGSAPLTDIDAGSVLAVAVAVVTYRLVNTVLISGVLFASTGKVPAALALGSRSEHLLDLATYGLGIITAGTVLHAVWLSVLVLPAAFLLQHHALLRQLVDAATKDTKTALLNASAWQRVAERELSRAQRQHLPAAVLMVDLDHFKRINDTYGHLAGDAALRAVSSALADELRDYDAVGRFGGEEFVALLPGVGGPQALHIAERVRHRIAGLCLSAGQQRGAFTVTASLGAAALGEHGSDLPGLLQAADDAVYAAKAAGRDMCRLAVPPVTAPLAA